MRRTEFVASYFDAWNHRDPQGVADHLSADGVYRDVPENRQRSQEDLLESLGEFFANYRHRYELIGEILKSRDTMAFQYRILPLGERGNSEANGIYHGAEFITLHGERATTIIDYYDIPNEIQAHKYAKSGLTRDQMLSHQRHLDQIMGTQGEFLKPDLTLPLLAETVGCSVNHLSQVINSGFGMSFFDYINRLRVEHAKKLLTRAESQDSAILNIAFAVGFNSNSAFYTAFRKFVGQTPAQYRKAHRA